MTVEVGAVVGAATLAGVRHQAARVGTDEVKVRCVVEDAGLGDTGCCRCWRDLKRKPQRD